MSNISIIDPLTDTRWDEFVESHPLGKIGHLSAWFKIIGESLGHMNGYCLSLQENGTIQAALPLFEVRSWLTGNRLVSIPFATLCDPLVSSIKDRDILIKEAVDLVDELGVSYIEIMTHATSELMQGSKFGMQMCYKLHYLLLDREPEQLKKSFHYTSVRQRITKALKMKLQIRMVEKEVDLRDFYRLYVMTRKRLRLPPQPYVFFEMLWESFSSSEKIDILLVDYKHMTIGGLLLLKYKDRVSAEYTVVDHNYRNMNPNHLLYWEGIQLACKQGFKIFDFGRSSINNNSLMDFKKRWGTYVEDLPSFFYPSEMSVKNQAKEDSLSYKLVRKICSVVPEKIYEPFGKLLYRHMG